MPKKIDWEKKLSPTAKAEILAGTFHLLCDHQPEIWKTVPAWLRAQIRQAMLDCGITMDEFTKPQLKQVVGYSAWLAEKYPQPGSELARLLKKRKKKSPTNA